MHSLPSPAMSRGSSVARPANQASGGSTIESAILRSIASAIPPTAWFMLRAQAIDRLRSSLQLVLAGSAWREPDEVLRDCGIVREGLHTTATLIGAALERLDTHARRAGFGGIDRCATNAPMPAPQPVPSPPRTHRLVDIAVFGRQCLPLLDPVTLQSGIEQLERARVGVVNATAPQRWQTQEIHAAAGLLGQAKQALAGALDRLTSCHHGLQRYLIGAIGTPRITQRSRRGSDRRAHSVHVGKQLRAARDAARTAIQEADRASTATGRVERRNARRRKKNKRSTSSPSTTTKPGVT